MPIVNYCDTQGMWRELTDNVEDAERHEVRALLVGDTWNTHFIMPMNRQYHRNGELVPPSAIAQLTIGYGLTHDR